MTGNIKPLILAVDDKPELLAAIVNMLQDNYRVMAITNGHTALSALKKHTPELFILDIEMPGIDGFATAALIRKEKRFEKTPIIFLTARNTREDVSAAIFNGGNDYLLKPIEKGLLLEKMQYHLEKSKQ